MLGEYGIENIILSIGYMGNKVRDYFGDGSKFGVKITCVDEGESKLGTLGPLNLAKEKLKDDRFLMLNGDILTKINLNNFITAHMNNVKSGGIGTIALTPVSDPSRFGVAKLSKNKILDFVEKPKRGEEPSNLINAGIYVLEKDVFNYIHKPKGMIEVDVFPKLAKEGKLFGYVFQEPWFDIGTPEDFARAERDWES